MSSGTPANNIGMSHTFIVDGTSGGEQLISKQYIFTNASYPSYVGLMAWNMLHGASSGDRFKFYSTGVAEKSSGAGDWASTSDERLKTSIVALSTSDCLDVVKALKPKKYKWINPELHDNVVKDDDGFSYGFMAQDLAEHDILKQYTTKRANTDESDISADQALLETASRAGDDIGEERIASIGGDKAFTIGAIQELSTKNDALEARILALENA
jgi:hypothetical protein